MAKLRKLTYAQVREKLCFGTPGISEWFEKWWRYASDGDLSETDVAELQEGLQGYLIDDRLDFVPSVANTIVDLLLSEAASWFRPHESSCSWSQPLPV